MEGEGVMMYANGDKYKGQWRENARNGNGKCLYANGDKYKGLSGCLYFSLNLVCRGMA